MSPAASSAVARPDGRRAAVPAVVDRALAPRAVYDACAPAVHAALALAGLVLLAPVFAIIALLIKTTSRGPVFYRGERAGRWARSFRIYKFRTMVVGAEQEIGGRLASDADKARLCTRVGRQLKRAKLDELPQFLNVVRGEMRLVGPRPVRPVFLPRLQAQVPGYRARFVVPPGVTGIAQLRGGYYTEPRDKLRYDLIYVAHRSLRLDLQVIALTFVKVLDRWLATGLLVLFLFCFVSFVPPPLHAELAVSVFGIHVSAVALLIVGAAAWTAVHRHSAGFALYRCPLNLAVPLFAVLATASAVAAPEPSRVVQGAGYYLATGLLLAFFIVNSLAGRQFVTLVVRAVALTSAAVSLIGLLRLFLVNHGALTTDAAMPRLSSVVGNPVALAVYLVLGVPLLMSEVTLARGRRARDFWLVCLTVSCVGVFLTQTRIGLVALLVSAAVFLRGRRLPTLLLAGVLASGVALLALTVTPRMSPTQFVADVGEWLGEHRGDVPPPGWRWLIGGRAAVGAGAGEAADTGVSNMHVSLMLEHGVAGWLLFLWLVAAVLRRMKAAHDRVRDKRLRRRLWAIISSVAGFLVSMNAMNTFHHLPIQVFFWSLLGIGLAIAVRLSGRPRNLIWRFGDAGD